MSRGPQDDDMVYVEIDNEVSHPHWVMHKRGGYHERRKGATVAANVGRRYFPPLVFNEDVVSWCQECWPVTVEPETPVWYDTVDRTVHRQVKHLSATTGPQHSYGHQGVPMDRYDALDKSTHTVCEECWG